MRNPLSNPVPKPTTPGHPDFWADNARFWREVELFWRRQSRIWLIQADVPTR
jgi:hypothetical protein